MQHWPESDYVSLMSFGVVSNYSVIRFPTQKYTQCVLISCETEHIFVNLVHISTYILFLID